MKIPSVEAFGREFFERCKRFRRIEAKHMDNLPYSHEAFALLRDVELCYAAKAYYACMVMANSIVEIHLKKIEGLTNTSHPRLRKAGLIAEVESLRNLRNDIAHGNENNELRYWPSDELEELWELRCLKVFELMHSLSGVIRRANGEN